MKLLLLTLLLSSCSLLKPKCDPDLTHAKQLENCMERFASQGYTADGVVKMCGKAYEKRD